MHNRKTSNYKRTGYNTSALAVLTKTNGKRWPLAVFIRLLLPSFAPSRNSLEPKINLEVFLDQNVKQSEFSQNFDARCTEIFLEIVVRAVIEFRTIIYLFFRENIVVRSWGVFVYGWQRSGKTSRFSE